MICRYSLRVIAALLLLAISPSSSQVQGDPGIQLIPKPQKIARSDGVFVLSSATPLRAGREASSASDLFRQVIRDVTGFALPDGSGTSGAGISLRLDPALASRGPEAYRLTVNAGGVTLESSDSRGLVCAIQTFRQLLPLERIVGLKRDLIEWRVPCVTIEDQPRFSWRGLMLDCSRTFQSPEYIRRTIDRMSLYKLNVLHLHLTDDQGWRIEIRKYPELTAKGARFPEKYAEPASHQGFYSQQEMRELVAYAAARNVTVVPEIEMPGHAVAALSCLPELSCTGGPFEIYPFFRGPNITSDIFCAGNDKTFEFIENVFGEIAQVFPSAFVHVGGDEAPKDAWKKCPRCQARIKAEGLKDEHELQRWFMQRVERILQKSGKRLIGWDEILEGGLAPGAAVMSWRGMSGGIAAAGEGHDVVMSPTSHCYFDYTYEKIDSRKAYSFEPVPPELPVDRVGHILGLQANFWSHIDREPEKVDRQVFPRLLAIAERGWSSRDTVDWADFSWRLKYHLVQLDQLGVRYHREQVPPTRPGPGAPRE